MMLEHFRPNQPIRWGTFAVPAARTQRHDVNRRHSALFERYLEGWAEANPAKILDAVPRDYRFLDPLVGVFTKWTLSQYFETLQARFDRAGAIARQDFAFFLRGPMHEPSREGEARFWREAPRLGLTGVAQIKFAEAGVLAESVSYDLNLASDILTRHS